MCKFQFQAAAVVGRVLLVALVLSGCDVLQNVGPSGQDQKFEIKSSGLAFGRRFGPDPIYWLDNDRALFPGYANEKRLGPDGKEVWAPPGLFIWDTKNDRIVRHADLARNFYFCYNEGFVTYTTHTEEDRKKWIQYEGWFGSEQALPPGSATNWAHNQSYYAACPKIDPEKLLRPEHRGRRVSAFFLREADGYIYVATQRSPDEWMVDRHNQDDPVKYYRTGQTEPIELPILAKEMWSQLSYSEFAGKYLLIPRTWKSRDLRNSIESWPKDLPYKVYLLHPAGNVESIDIPYGTWRPEMAFLTRKGLFWVSSSAPSTNSKQAGGWLLQNGKPVKLFEHLPEGVGVSPDGCKIVYAVNDYNRDTVEFVHLIDLCK
jgi:hypothetical protein